VNNDIRVIIVEHDPFSRNWMALLAARDCRTRVVGEAEDLTDLLPLLKNQSSRIDLILLDTDIPGEVDCIPLILKETSNSKHPPSILCTGIKPNLHVLNQLSHPIFKGYVKKGEIQNSLVWAITFAMEGYWVISDSIQALASSTNFSLPKPCIVIEGRYITKNLTEHQANVARLAFIFSMERHDLANELGITEDWGYGLVSAVYEKIGLKEILSGEFDTSNYFGDNHLLVELFEKLRKGIISPVKARDMETLAFHLLTMPEFTELK